MYDKLATVQFRLNSVVIILGLAIAVGGCAGQSSESNQASATPAAVPVTTAANSDEPRSVTDLSQLSSRAAVQSPIVSMRAPDSAAPPERGSNAIIQQNIERMFVSNVDQLRYREGHANAPGQTTLLNDKARRFSEFSYQLLNQTLTAARSIEPDRLAGRKLPEDIAPMILTATMDSQGRLTEISIDSHSGDHQVDQIIIDSCKQGLWSRNPPQEAMGASGVYRLRVRGYIWAYSVSFKGVYKYQTELALGIL